MPTRYGLKMPSGMRKLQQGGSAKLLRGARRHVSVAVRKSLAEIQRNHIKKQMVRTKKKGTTGRKDQKLYVRTGELARSYRISHQRGQITGKYGSDLRRSVKLEKGGTIRPKKKYLAIPLPGVKGYAREKSGLVPVQTAAGSLVLLNRDSGKAQYVLKKSVTLPARPTMNNAVDAMLPTVDNLLADAWQQGIAEGIGDGKA